nr:hypothetical protein [candidate division Zixibacteria bacterium]
MHPKKLYNLPLKTEAMAFTVLAVMALILRLNQLTADPPVGLSASHGVYTDPGQYIAFARNYILWGSFNPLHDFRLIFFLKSTMTLLSLGVFKIFGVGYWQANLCGLLFSYPTIILMYFVVRKTAGSLAALFYLIFISLEYTQIFFGRLPFLENSMNLFAVLSFTVLLYGRRAYAFFISGLFLAVGIFFGKVIGLIYLFPFAVYSVYSYFGEYRPDWRKLIIRYSLFCIGFAAVMIFWYFYSYLPASRAVTGYLEEQAVDLYGTPDAFKNFDIFIYNWLSFGAKSYLFQRMPVPALLTWGIILIFVFRIGFKASWKNKFFGLTPGIVFMIALVLAAYGSLMIWNYRPLRYQTMLIYPICGLAGVFLANLINGSQSPLDRRGYWLFHVFFFILVLIPVYQLIGPIYNALGYPYHYTEVRNTVLVTAIVISVAVTLLMRLRPRFFKSPGRVFRNVFILAAVIAALVPSAIRYISWSDSATFLTVNNSRDLGTILSQEAVVSGPYAPAFTHENRLMNFIHMFGVAKADPDFFEKYPVTHLLLDISNEESAGESYPELMEQAVSIAKYRVGGRDVNLYRVAGFTGNTSARRYQLSSYEHALESFKNEDAVSGHSYLQYYLQNHPDNQTANLASAIIARESELYDEAEYYFKKGIEFNSTDFYLHFKLAEFYIDMYKLTGNTDLEKKGYREIELARKYNPDSRKLIRDIDELLARKDS